MSRGLHIQTLEAERQGLRAWGQRVGGEGPKSKGKMGKSPGWCWGLADQQGSLCRETPRALEEAEAVGGSQVVTRCRVEPSLPSP